MSKSGQRQRTKTVSFCLDPDGHALLKRVASPLSPGQFARALTMQAAEIAPLPPGRRPLPKVQDANLLRAALAEMGHWGGNLNQLAHNMNTGMPLGNSSVERLRAELEPIKTRLLIALGVVES